MKSRVGKLKLLSHGFLPLAARKQVLRKSLVQSVLGSITLTLVGSLMGSLVSCSSAPNPSNTSQATTTPTISPSPNSTNSPLFSSPNNQTPNNPSLGKENSTPAKPLNPEVTKSPKSPSSAAKNTVSINIYQVDNQCNDFIAERMDVPQNNSLDMAVSKVIEKSNINEFSLSNSKVTINPQGIATIDFQVAANSKRRFISLSSCEQFNLFGSLRKTLIDNPDWQIKDVRFTEGGKEIVL